MTTQSNPSTAMVKAIPVAEPFQPENLDQAMHLAKDISASSIVPERFRGKESDSYVAILWGRDLGLTPMQAIFGVWIEPRSGRPGLYDHTAAALVLRSPLCKYLRCIETTDERATWETWRVGNPEPDKMSFTIAEAKQAGLLGKDNWKAYPSAMLRARARMMLGRAVYPDVLANVYTPDELEEMRDRNAIEVTSQVTAPPPPPPTPAKPSPPPAPRGPGPSAKAQAMFEEEAEAKRQGSRNTSVPSAAAPPKPDPKPPRPAAGPAPSAAIPPAAERASGPAAPAAEHQATAGDEAFGPSDAEPKPNSPVDVGFEDLPPAPATSDAEAALVDTVTGGFMSASTMAEYKHNRAEMEKLRTDEKQWVVPHVIECLVRIVEKGPEEDVDPAFAALGKARAAKMLPESLRERAESLYKSRKAAINA